jgi:hypothetical protein
MTDETLYSFLLRRERELTHRIAALQGQLTPLERELAEIKRTSGAVQASIHGQPAAVSLEMSVGLALGNKSNVAIGVMPADIVERFAAMTIKELVIQALLDAFPNGGTPVQIREFISNAYAREIEPSSLRPQMHRLKADGVLGQDPTGDIWNFRDGKRLQYAMFDHPTSRAGMKELQDDAIANSDQQTNNARGSVKWTVVERAHHPAAKDVNPASDAQPPHRAINRKKDPLFDD